MLSDEPQDNRINSVKADYAWDNPASKVIVYRFQKYTIHDRQTVEGVQEVVSWIEANVATDHEEYEPLMRIAHQRLAELSSSLQAQQLRQDRTGAII